MLGHLDLVAEELEGVLHQVHLAAGGAQVVPDGAVDDFVAEAKGVPRGVRRSKVADVMDREPVAIPDELSIEQALDEYFLRYRWPWFPVVDTAHRFLQRNRKIHSQVVAVAHIIGMRRDRDLQDHIARPDERQNRG